MTEAVVTWLQDYMWYWGANATLVVVLAGILVWILSNFSAVSGAVKKLGEAYGKLPSAWQGRLRHLAAIAWVALVPLLLTVLAGIEMSNARWEGAAILGVAVVGTAAGARILRKRPGWLATMDIVLLAAAIAGEQAVYQSRLRAQWSMDKVYVVLPTRATTEEKAEEVQRFWREYVNTNRLVFDGIKSLRVEPSLWDGRDAIDEARVKRFDQQLDPERSSHDLRKQIRQVLRREPFCPAIVITSQVRFADVAGSNDRSVRTAHEIYVESSAPDTPPTLKLVSLPGRDARLTTDDVKFLALRLAFAVIELLPELACDPSPRLSDAERDGAVRQVLRLYRKFLSTAPSDRQPGDLLERVDRLVSGPSFTLDDARKVLDSYGVEPGRQQRPEVPPRADALVEKLKNL
jgi:hypothetical protein